MPCPTADLKLALSSFLRVQFHGCHFALGVGAFLTPQCGFYKFHQPAPAPAAAAAVFKQQHNNKTAAVVVEPTTYHCCLRSGIYRWQRPVGRQSWATSRLLLAGMHCQLADRQTVSSGRGHVYTMANRGLFKHAWNWQASTPKWTHLTRRRSKTSELNVPIAIPSCCLVY